MIKIGYDPTDVKAPEDIIRKKNVDISALRKKLKLPSTEDLLGPYTTSVSPYCY